MPRPNHPRRGCQSGRERTVLVLGSGTERTISHDTVACGTEGVRQARLQATGESARASTAATLTFVVAGQRSLGSKQQCAIQSLLHRAEAVQHVCNGSQGERPVESGPCCAALHSAGCTGAWSANDSPDSVRPPARPPLLRLKPVRNRRSRLPQPYRPPAQT